MGDVSLLKFKIKIQLAYFAEPFFKKQFNFFVIKIEAYDFFKLLFSTESLHSIFFSLLDPTVKLRNEAG